MQSRLSFFFISISPSLKVLASLSFFSLFFALHFCFEGVFFVQHMGLEQPMPAPFVPPVTQPPHPFGGQMLHSDRGIGMQEQYYQQHQAQHVAQPHTHLRSDPRPSMRVSQDGSVEPFAESPEPQQVQEPQQQPKQPPSNPNKLDVSKQRLEDLGEIISTASPELRKLVASHNRCVCSHFLSFDTFSTPFYTASALSRASRTSAI